MIKINWKNIPNKPGTYLWKDKDNQVIYVGKAKDLKNRMQQYFKNNLSIKNKLLVKEISFFDFQISSNEIDALILEQTLINKYAPKYNIKIKGAKVYPYIEVLNNERISLRITKKTNNKNSKYFGPYPDGYSPRKIIEILNSVFPIDKCLSRSFGKKCINYDMGRCPGYCFKKVSDQEKSFIFHSTVDFLSGKTSLVKERLIAKLNKMNSIMKFEESIKITNYLETIKKIEDQKSYNFIDSIHRDIFNFYYENNVISISIMHIRFGNIDLTTNYISDLLIYDEEQIESMIHRYYLNNPFPDEVIVPFKFKHPDLIKAKLILPVKGSKKNILHLVKDNAKEKYNLNINSHLNKLKIFNDVKKFFESKLNIKDTSLIEMVDISSTMGKEQVGTVISFRNGIENKSSYRKYIIRDTEIMDDYMSTNEVVRRHFNNKIKNNLEIPNIFIVDGKYQLVGAQRIIKNLGIKNIKVIALKKNIEHKTESLINDNFDEIEIKNYQNVYLFLSKIQDEAHRFSINFHRLRRDKKITESELDKFKFLSQNDKDKLFKEFKSIRKIFISSEDDLKKIIGTKNSKLFIEQK